MTTRAVVSLSGGLDSTSVLALAVYNHGAENVQAVSFHYGQKHSLELEQAAKIAGHYGVSHQLVELPKVFSSAISTLIEGGPDNPELTYAEIEEAEGVSPTYVPYRNGNLLSMCAAIAMATVEGSDDDAIVYCGVHMDDARGGAYPDCTPEFIGAQGAAIWIGTYGKVRVNAPLQWMTKTDVVRQGLSLKAPFEYTLSCYNGVRPSCGRCPTCVERVQAFRELGEVDPVPYAIEVDWTPILPKD